MIKMIKEIHLYKLDKIAKKNNILAILPEDDERIGQIYWFRCHPQWLLNKFVVAKREKSLN